MLRDRVAQWLRGIGNPPQPQKDGEFQPYLPTRIDRKQLISDVSDFLYLDAAEVRDMFRTYRKFHRDKRYAADFGELKTLNLEEAFVLYAVLATRRPTGPLVEIGTQYGRSTRRILDMIELLGLDNEVICYDISDDVQHFRPDEARLIVRDVTDSFVDEVLRPHRPALIYLDAHPYGLLHNVIRDFLQHGEDCILAVHDCAKGLCRLDMQIDKSDPGITSSTGHWERHVLCGLFGISDPASDAIDHVETSECILRIFGTTHGLAAIRNKLDSPRELS